MGRAYPSAQPSLLIAHAPMSRRQKMARLRTIVVAAIAAVAVSGVALQEAGLGQPAGARMAANPSAFDYFPG